MGLLIYGDLFGKLVNYNLAVMNGQGINLKDKNNQKDIVGSLMIHPLDWLSVGGSFVKGERMCCGRIQPQSRHTGRRKLYP